MQKIMVAPYKTLKITDDEVVFGKQHIPLSGAHAEVVTNQSGLFKRNVRTTMLVTAADGSQLTYTVGAGFGTKGGASRTWQTKAMQAMAAINTAAAHAAQ